MNDNIEAAVARLINDFYSKSDELKYINLNDKKMYSGWVTDFHIYSKNCNENSISLNLKNETDLFLFFILILAWSRTDNFENAPFLIAYIILNGKNEIDYWKNNQNIIKEINDRKTNAKNIGNITTGLKSRYKISFRKDIFESIYILAQKWSDINKVLKDYSSQNDYIGFMKYINNISGLGCGKNSIFIKIPLILRELRCQNVFNNIPGELCCVIDDRVIKACKIIGLDIPTRYNSINYLINSSKIIYKYFGDLYDIPLFAYEDIYG